MYIAHIRKDGTIQTCTEHSRNTATIASTLLKSSGLEATAYLGGLIHDMGKFSLEFNDYITKAVQGEKLATVIHSFAASYFLLNNYHKTSSDTYVQCTAEILSAATASHHGLIDCVNSKGENAFEHRMSKQPEYEKRAIAEFIKECATEQEIDSLFKKATFEIQQKIEKFQKISTSNEEMWFLIGMLTRMITSAIIMGDRTDTANFMAEQNLILSKKVDWDKCTNSQEEMLNGFNCTTPIQLARRAFSDECKNFASMPSGVYRLDLPTGGGKTLSGLRYALYHSKQYNKKKIFYVAPLLSIIEQNVDVIRQAIKNDDIVLEHHSNVINDADSNNWHIYKLQETWESPIIVTTLVRVLETMFSGKTDSVRRFVQLCDSVIIFDEVQSIPNNMLNLFNFMINFLTTCCGATVVLCSATQPEFSVTSHPMIKASPIISQMTLNKYESYFKRTEIINIGSKTITELATTAENFMQKINSLLIVCNTKRDAQKLYNLIDVNQTEKFFLTAGMCVEHRRDVLKNMMAALSANKKLICISTQVIEAGIDISFENVIRVSAGIDNIVQAAGRCNRHGEYNGIKEVYVVRLIGEELGQLKDIENAQEALNSLFSSYNNNPSAYENSLQSMPAISYYFNTLYGKYDIGHMDYSVTTNVNTSLFSMLGFNDKYVEQNSIHTNYIMWQAFKEAGTLFSVFGEETKTIIVPYGTKGAQLIEDIKQAVDIKPYLKAIRGYTISVYENAYEKLKKAGAITEIYENSMAILDSNFYNSLTGLVLTSK